jgi:hypothetical protein
VVEIVLAAERASAEAIRRVEFLGAEDGATVGSLAAQRGRLCWAAARNQQPTLSDIFCQEAGLPRALLEEIFREAKARRWPFGQLLVERNVVAKLDLQRCLRRQIAAALVALSDLWPSGGRIRVSRPAALEGEYDEELTLAPLRALAACLEQSPQLTSEAGEVPGLFRRLSRGVASSLCFRTTPGSPGAPLPVASASLEELPLAHALGIGREALAVVRSPALLAAAVEPEAVLMHRDGAGVVLWLERLHLCVFGIADRGQYGEILATLRASPRACVEAR